MGSWGTVSHLILVGSHKVERLVGVVENGEGQLQNLLNKKKTSSHKTYHSSVFLKSGYVYP